MKLVCILSHEEFLLFLEENPLTHFSNPLPDVYCIHITPEVELFISGAARALPPPPLPLQFAAQPGQFLSNTQDSPPPPRPPQQDHVSGR